MSLWHLADRTRTLVSRGLTPRHRKNRHSIILYGPHHLFVLFFCLAIHRIHLLRHPAASLHLNNVDNYDVFVAVQHKRILWGTVTTVAQACVSCESDQKSTGCHCTIGSPPVFHGFLAKDINHCMPAGTLPLPGLQPFSHYCFVTATHHNGKPICAAEICTFSASGWPYLDAFNCVNPAANWKIA